MTFCCDIHGSSFVVLQRALQHDMPRRCFFTCVRETDQQFIDRSGWVYRQGASVYLPADDILVLPPQPQPQQQL